MVAFYAKKVWPIAGFRIDTGYSNKDPLDKTQKQGQGYRGYATFVKNDAQGNTSKSRFG